MDGVFVENFSIKHRKQSEIVGFWGEFDKSLSVPHLAESK